MSPVVVERDRADSVIAEAMLRAKIKRDAPPEPVYRPLEWAEKRRNIRGEPFCVPAPLRAVYADEAREIVVAKAAQVGASEYAINTALWVADTKAGRRGNSLYVLPAIAQSGDFVRARIDTAVEESPYLRERVKPLHGLFQSKVADNVGLKRIGQGWLYVRGSNAEAGLVSVDADAVFYDEVDRLKAGTLAYGQKRLGSSLLGWQRYVSTPIYPEVGIDALWLTSSRQRWQIKCEHCNEWQVLSFPDNLREDGSTVCAACKASIDRLGPGEWVAENPGVAVHGYHLTKLLSERADIAEVAKIGYRILNRDETDQSTIQQFYNQDLGLPHAPEGGQLSRAEIEACIADYSLADWAPTRCTMGVDVGAKLHVRINAPSPAGNSKSRVAVIRTVGWDDLPGLMRQHDVSCCVIDAQPETQKAREFANKFPSRVWLCYYPDPATWPHKQAIVWKRDESIVQAHRTITLDALFAEVRERRTEYPREVMSLPEFVPQMMAPVRVIEKDGRGELVGKYVEGGKADHYCHASNYEKIARMRGSGDPFSHVVLPGERR